MGQCKSVASPIGKLRKARNLKNYKPKDTFVPECMICFEIKREVKLTQCCKKVVCNDCAGNLEQRCPQKCKNDGKIYFTNKHIDDAAQNYRVSCELCGDYVRKADLKEHLKECSHYVLEQNENFPDLHKVQLEATFIEEEGWKCAARNGMLEYHLDKEGWSQAYTCPECEKLFCRLCIVKMKQGHKLERKNPVRCKARQEENIETVNTENEEMQENQAEEDPKENEKQPTHDEEDPGSENDSDSESEESPKARKSLFKNLFGLFTAKNEILESESSLGEQDGEEVKSDEGEEEVDSEVDEVSEVESEGTEVGRDEEEEMEVADEYSQSFVFDLKQ